MDNNYQVTVKNLNEIGLKYFSHSTPAAYQLTHTHTHLYECSDGAQRAVAGDVLVLRAQQDGGVAGTLTSLHLHLHQAVLVPGTVLHQVDEQAQTLNTTPHTHTHTHTNTHTVSY